MAAASDRVVAKGVVLAIVGSSPKAIVSVGFQDARVGSDDPNQSPVRFRSSPLWEVPHSGTLRAAQAAPIGFAWSQGSPLGSPRAA